MSARRPDWYAESTSTKKAQATVGKPLNVFSISSSHQKPGTVMPRPSGAQQQRFGVWYAVATNIGAKVTSASGKDRPSGRRGSRGRRRRARGRRRGRGCADRGRRGLHSVRSMTWKPKGDSPVGPRRRRARGGLLEGGVSALAEPAERASAGPGAGLVRARRPAARRPRRRGRGQHLLGDGAGLVLRADDRRRRVQRPCTGRARGAQRSSSAQGRGGASAWARRRRGSFASALAAIVARPRGRLGPGRGRTDPRRRSRAPWASQGSRPRTPRRPGSASTKARRGARRRSLLHDLEQLHFEHERRVRGMTGGAPLAP